MHLLLLYDDFTDVAVRLNKAGASTRTTHSLRSPTADHWGDPSGSPSDDYVFAHIAERMLIAGISKACIVEPAMTLPTDLIADKDCLDDSLGRNNCTCALC